MFFQVVLEIDFFTHFKPVKKKPLALFSKTSIHFFVHKPNPFQSSFQEGVTQDYWKHGNSG